MSSTTAPLVAFIIGAGSNVGLSTAKLLKSKGYAVALGSRAPNIEATKKEGYFPVAVDVTKVETLQSAFDLIKKELGEPNIVVFNPYSFTAPTDPSDPLTLSLDAFTRDFAFGAGLFAAAQAAFAGLKSKAHQSAGSPRVFIATGNILPFVPPVFPKMIGLGVQKVAQAYLIEAFARAYKDTGIRFHYATMVGPNKLIPEDFLSSGPAHAEAYWDLATRETPAKWDYRFTVDGEVPEDYYNLPVNVEEILRDAIAAG